VPTCYLGASGINLASNRALWYFGPDDSTNSGRLVANRVKIPAIIVFLIFAILGISLVTTSVHWGFGIDIDSVHYIQLARNLKAGEGFRWTYPDGGLHPCTHWPPLFPAAICAISSTGMNEIQAGKWLNLLLFGMIIILVGYLVFTYSQSIIAATLASFLMCVSVSNLWVYSIVWSEPLYNFFAVLGLAFLAAYIGKNRTRHLVVSAAAVALAFLTRYAGAALVITAILALLFLDRERRKKKLRDVLLFCAISCTPTGLWLIRNTLLTGSFSTREFVFHIPWFSKFFGIAGAVLRWFFSIPAPKPIQGVVLAVILIILVSLCFRYRKKILDFLLNRKLSGRHETQTGERNNILAWLPVILILFCMSHIAFNLFSMLFFDADIHFGIRQMSPVYISLFLVAACFFVSMPLTQLKSAGKTGLISLLAVFCLLHATGAWFWAADRIENGYWFSGPEWVNSKILEKARSLDPSVPVYSNAARAIYILIEECNCIPIPARTSRTSLQPFHTYKPLLEKMRKRMREEDGKLVWFNWMDVKRWDYPAEEEMVRELNLTVYCREDDGTIYTMPDKVPAEDYLRFGVYNNDGVICYAHFLFRDGALSTSRKNKPGKHRSKSGLIDAGQTAEAWQFAESVAADIKEGSYFSGHPEELIVEICMQGRKYRYEFNLNKNGPPAPDKLKKLLLILYGLTDW